jgi:hypothetical protein
LYLAHCADQLKSLSPSRRASPNKYHFTISLLPPKYTIVTFWV